MIVKPKIVVAALVLLLAAQAAAIAGERTVTLEVDGMTCVSCPYFVKQILTRIDGVGEVKVSLRAKSAVVTFDDEKTGVEALTEATANVGFPSRVVR